jgi:hypothetical protein
VWLVGALHGSPPDRDPARGACEPDVNNHIPGGQSSGGLPHRRDRRGGQRLETAPK